MNKRDNGGPAFPAHPSALGDHDGMTLRDYFAAKAMAGLAPHFPTDAGSSADCALVAYRIADAMLKARTA
jgi:hypothetical protein